MTAAALAAAVLPAATAVADSEPAKKVSAWGKHSPRFTMAAVKVGANRPPKSTPSKTPTDAIYLPWLLEQRAHAKALTGKKTADTTLSAGKGVGNKASEAFDEGTT
ncbi:hypothetical protein [Streptomyces sp. NPDC055056]